MEILPT